MEPLFPKHRLLKDIVAESDGLPLYKAYLPGAGWVEGDGRIAVRSPIDGSTVAYSARVSLESGLKSLSVVYRSGRWSIRGLPGERRLEALLRAADLMEEAFNDFVDVLIAIAGKTRKQAEGEVEASIDRLRKAPLDLRRLQGDYIPGDWDRHTLESEALVRREPYGVVMAIIPFNYPLFDTVNKVAYSMLPGNAVIIKPTSQNPLPSIMFVRLLLEAGIPQDSIAVMPMPGGDAEKLAADRRISVVSLTGSSSTGKRILAAAGIKQYILELGGGDPAIVLADADLRLAASKVATGIASYAGQRCDAIKLVLVEEPVYQEFRELLVRELRSLKVGDPRRSDTDVGPVISEEAADRMMEAVKEAVEAGGRVLVGGRRLGPTLVEPTLVEVLDHDVLKGLRLYREEVFAPVAVITPFKSLDEAVELANGRPYGLDAAIFGENITRIRRLIRLLEVGAIYINEYPRHGIGYYPYGGRKDSGVGREGIGYSIEQVTALKTIVYNYRGRGIWEYL